MEPLYSTIQSLYSTIQPLYSTIQPLYMSPICPLSRVPTGRVIARINSRWVTIFSLDIFLPSSTTLNGSRAG